MKAAALLLAVALPAAAQQGPLDDNLAAREGPRLRPERVDGGSAPIAGQPTGAVLKTLDKVSSSVTEVVVPGGDATRLGPLEIRVGQCRFPPSNPTGEAYAWVEVREDGVEGPIFAGWMVASSPALNALDHPRYDIWVVRCASV